MLRLIVPKHVEFKNRRLKVLYNVLQLSTLVLLFVRFFEGRLWLRTTSISHLVNAELWVNAGSADRLSEVWQDKASSPLCTSPELFDFAWGGEDGQLFENHECLPPCGAQGTWPHCMHEAETHRREAESQVFFVTQFEERRTEANGESTRSFAFVPHEEAHSVGLMYGYSVPVPSWWGTFSASDQDELPIAQNYRGCSDGFGGDGILTVLLDREGQVSRVEEPRPVINIPLTEVLELAGEHGALDSPHKGAGPNSQQEGPQSEGGLGRITGLNIDLRIECFPSQQEPLPGREDWGGPVCYVRAKRSDTRQWASWELVEPLGQEGAVRRRLHHGVRVRAVTDGSFHFFDANSLFLQLTASLVFLALPNKFMYFTLNYALGHLSTIYRGVLIELFDVQMECARLTTRLMSNSVAFVELEDTPAETGGFGCISKMRVEEQLREVLRYRGATLDEEEIAGVVHFCHDSVLKSAQLQRRDANAVVQIKEAVERGVGSPTNADANELKQLRKCPTARVTLAPSLITIDDFSMCCAATPNLEFESFVRLFDKDRGIRFLERFFLPPKLRPEALMEEGLLSMSAADGHDRGSMFNLHSRHQKQMNLLQNLKMKALRRGNSAESDIEKPRPCSTDTSGGFPKPRRGDTDLCIRTSAGSGEKLRSSGIGDRDLRPPPREPSCLALPLGSPTRLPIMYERPSSQPRLSAPAEGERSAMPSPCLPGTPAPSEAVAQECEEDDEAVMVF